MPHQPLLQKLLFCIATAVAVTLASPPTGSLPCVVVDRTRGSTITDATICINNTTHCYKSDNSGRAHLLDCAVGVYTITASASSYDTLVIPNVVINTGINTTLSIELLRSAQLQELDKMTVSAKRIATKKAEQVASVTRLNSFDLQNTAGTANDVNRVLQTLPSVVTGGTDFDNTMVVRGGHSRENVFLLDGMELDNISHFSDVGSSGGSFGFIDGALLQSLDFYAGSIPASLPARMSSVIDMTMREGSITNRSYQIHLNSAGAGITAEGPLPQKRGSYLVSARYVDTRSVKDLLNMDGLPRFGDGQVKLTVPLNESNKLSLTSIASYDNYQENIGLTDDGCNSDYEFSLSQLATGIQLNTTKTDFKNRVLLSYYIRNELGIEKVRNFLGRFDIDNEWYFKGVLIDGYTPPIKDTAVIHHRYSVTDKESYRFGDDRSTTQLKDDFTLYLRGDDQLKIGATASRQRLTCVGIQNKEWVTTYYYLSDTTNPSSPVDSFIDSNRPYATDSTVYDTAIGGYVNYVVNEGPLKAVIGVRADYFRMLRDYGISPRVAVSYDVPQAGTFAVSGGLYYQLPAELGARIRDLMVPNPSFSVPNPPLSAIELQRSWQGVLSYEKQFAGSHVLTIETYGKWYDREYPMVVPGYYAYQQEFTEATEASRAWKLGKPDGKKRALGLELSFLKKEQKGLYYGLSYSMSSVENKYSNGKWYADAENVRNHGSVLLGCEFLRRHSISSRIYFSEGRPYSKGLYEDKNNSQRFDTTVAYYSQRLDPVFSVNVRYNFRFYPSFGTVTGYIEAWNLLNYRPIVSRTNGWQQYYDREALGIIPFVGVTADF